MKIRNMVRMLRNAQYECYAKGDIIIHQENSDKTLFYIRKGMVRSFARQPLEEEVTFQLYPEKNVFGNIHAILFDEPSKFTFQAIEPTNVYRINQRVLMEITSNDPNLVTFNSSMIGHRLLKRSFQRLQTFVFLSPEERYIQYLHDFPNVVNRAPDKYTAHVLGITPVSLSRIRNRMSVKK